MRKRVIVEVPEESPTQAEPAATTTTTTTTGSSDPVQEGAQDLAERLRERLELAESDGLIESLEMKKGRGSGSRSASKAQEPEAPPVLQGMDLTLLSGMLWDTLSDVRGYKSAGVPVDDASKAKWGQALAPVLEKLLGDLVQEYHSEATLLIVTLLIVLPRERVVWIQKKEENAPSISVR